MSRKQEFSSGGSNPTTLWLEWKSDEKKFEYWDKESQTRKQIPLPFTFLVLKEMSKVSGWHEPRQDEGSRIFSNEIKYMSEEISVKYAASSNGKKPAGELCKGLYKDVKEKIKTAGGHYCKSIYAITKKGTLINIQIKGAVVQEWGNFTQKTKNRLPDEWVTVTGADSRTKGKVNYSVPIFSFSGSLTKEEEMLADTAYNEIDGYMKGGVATQEEVVEMVSDDDLPF